MSYFSTTLESSQADDKECPHQALARQLSLSAVLNLNLHPTTIECNSVCVLVCEHGHLYTILFRRRTLTRSRYLELTPPPAPTTLSHTEYRFPRAR
jgi:hypothetical protein